MKRQQKTLLATLCSALMLTACGGSSSGSSPTEEAGSPITPTQPTTPVNPNPTTPPTTPTNPPAVKPDTDKDGVLDATDNCANTANADQKDLDKDGKGDVCDSDKDGDGVDNAADAFPDDKNESLDTDKDGTGNNADTDDDGDGFSDADEKTAGTDPLDANDKPTTPNPDNEIPDLNDPSLKETEVLAQKGPFQKGAVLGIYAVGTDGQPTTLRQFGRMNANEIALFPSILMSDRMVWFTVYGNVYDEYHDKVINYNKTTDYRDPKATLMSWARVKDGKVIGNANLFGWLGAKRAAYLMKQRTITDEENAWTAAKADLYDEFRLTTDPMDLDIKKTGLDNDRLLALSTGVMACKTSSNDFAKLADDFADDGEINNPDSQPIWACIDKDIPARLERARVNLNKRYGISRFIQYKQQSVSRAAFQCQHANAAALCPGAEVIFERVPGRSWTDPKPTSVTAYESGAYAIQAGFGTFNNFHQVRFTEDDVLTGFSGDGRNGQVATHEVDLGKAQYGYSLYSNEDEGKVITARLNMFKVADGTKDNPQPLMRDIAITGNIHGSHDAHYLLENLGYDTEYSVFLSDITLDRSNELKIEVFDLDPDSGLANRVRVAQLGIDGSLIKKLPFKTKTGRVYIRVQDSSNKSTSNFKLKVKQTQKSPQAVSQ